MNKTLSFILPFSLAFFSCTYSTNEKKPNIIFIMTDDHATQAISAYEGRLNETPGMDEMAAEGIIFKNAFVTNSICAPARAVILTGKYSHLNGVKDNSTKFDSTQLTFPKIFQRNGYETAIIGKWHLKSQPTGFDYWNVLPGQGEYYNPRFINNGYDTVYEGYVTDIITENAIEWLSHRNSEKPFLLMVHHKAPHRNWMPALKYLNAYEHREFPIPGSFNDNYGGREHLKKQKLTISRHMDIMYDLKIPCDTCETAEINQWAGSAYRNMLAGLTGEQRAAWEEGYEEEIMEFESLEPSGENFNQWKFNRYIQDYLRCILSVDESISEINRYLGENNLHEKTLVVYTSDQGFFLGEHGLFDKRYMYEESIRTPLIMKYPERIKKGTVSEHLVLNLDMAPTFLDLAGMDIPPSMQGRSLVPLFEVREEQNWRDAVYYHYYEDAFGVAPHYGVRTRNFKLIRFDANPASWELYDLQDDPCELNNLYPDPNYEGIANGLKQKLEELRFTYQITTN
jgi:arylsulfatase A-like enzyme